MKKQHDDAFVKKQDDDCVISYALVAIAIGALMFLGALFAAFMVIR